MSFDFRTSCGPDLYPFWPVALGLFLGPLLFLTYLLSRPSNSFRAAILPLPFCAASGTLGFYALITYLPDTTTRATEHVALWRNALWYPFWYGITSSALMLSVFVFTRRPRATRWAQFRLAFNDTPTVVVFLASGLSWNFFTLILLTPASLLANPAFSEPGHRTRTTILASAVYCLLVSAAHTGFALFPIGVHPRRSPTVLNRA
jgi:hypothetical protein